VPDDVPGDGPDWSAEGLNVLASVSIGLRGGLSALDREGFVKIPNPFYLAFEVLLWPFARLGLVFIRRIPVQAWLLEKIAAWGVPQETLNNLAGAFNQMNRGRVHAGGWVVPDETMSKADTVMGIAARTPVSERNWTVPVCDRCKGSLGMDGSVVPADANVCFNDSNAGVGYIPVHAFQKREAARQFVIEAGWKVEGDEVICPACQAVAVEKSQPDVPQDPGEANL